MSISLHCGIVVAILPIGATSLPSLVVGLRGTADNQLHALCNFSMPAVLRQQVSVVGGDDKIEYAKIEPLAGLKQLTTPYPAVSRET